MSYQSEVTPRLILDEGRLQRNIERMANRVEILGGTLRPHIKTHKSPKVAEMQLSAGAVGITVATVREAEVMIDAGIDDILIAYPPIGDFRLKTIERLAERAKLTIACAEAAHVTALATAHLHVAYYWEIDVGAKRLGTEPRRQTAETIASLQELDGPQFAGLMTFPGHAYAARDLDSLQAIARAERDALSSTVSALEALGVTVGVTSAGATPLAIHEDSLATEFRFGNYVFNDATQVALGSAIPEDCALRVEAQIVGVPAPDRLILDAGSKALSAERMSGLTESFALVEGHPRLTVHTLYEEHAIVAVADGSRDYQLGQRLRLIPNHACTCANLHESYLVERNDGSVDVWPVAARGWRPLGEVEA